MKNKGNIFNQREISELQKTIAFHKIPFSFKIRHSDNSIELTFLPNPLIKATLKKQDSIFYAEYYDSNGNQVNIEKNEWNKFRYQLTNWIKAIKRDNPFEIEQKEHINLVSPNFYEVFKEATIIDGLGFKESSGMIFRKSLEIIVKDFLKNQLPKNYESLISEKTIGQIIYHFYEKDDNNLITRKKGKFEEIETELNELTYLIKKISNTFKIGNDFSHYERRLSKFTSLDMKSNILQIVEYIDNRIISRTLDMEKKEMDEKLKTDKLIR